MRRTTWLGLAVAGLALLACSACCTECLGGENAAKPATADGVKERPAQLLCPLTGAKLAESETPTTVEIDGFRFLVADKAAAAKAKENPADAFKALAKNGDAAEPVSQACPVMGNRIDKKLFVYRDGRRVYMCCKGCTKRIENNWDAMLKKLAQQAKDGDPENLKGM